MEDVSLGTIPHRPLREIEMQAPAQSAAPSTEPAGNSRQAVGRSRVFGRSTTVSPQHPRAAAEAPALPSDTVARQMTQSEVRQAGRGSRFRLPTAKQTMYALGTAAAFGAGLGAMRGGEALVGLRAAQNERRLNAFTSHGQLLAKRSLEDDYLAARGYLRKSDKADAVFRLLESGKQPSFYGLPNILTDAPKTRFDFLSSTLFWNPRQMFVGGHTAENANLTAVSPAHALLMIAQHALNAAINPAKFLARSATAHPVSDNFETAHMLAETNSALRDFKNEAKPQDIRTLIALPAESVSDTTILEDPNIVRPDVHGAGEKIDQARSLYSRFSYGLSDGIAALHQQAAEAFSSILPLREYGNVEFNTSTVAELDHFVNEAKHLTEGFQSATHNGATPIEQRAKFAEFSQRFEKFTAAFPDVPPKHATDFDELTAEVASAERANVKTSAVRHFGTFPGTIDSFPSGEVPISALADEHALASELEHFGDPGNGTYNASESLATYTAEVDQAVVAATAKDLNKAANHVATAFGFDTLPSSVSPIRKPKGL